MIGMLKRMRFGAGIGPGGFFHAVEKLFTIFSYYGKKISTLWITPAPAKRATRQGIILAGMALVLGAASPARATNLISENIQSWTSRASYGTWTQVIPAGTVNMTRCIVQPSAAASGVGTIGRIQLEASTGIVQLPSVNSVGTVTMNLAAGATGRTVILQKNVNGAGWTTVTTWSGIGTTGAAKTYTLNDASANIALRLSSPSAAIYVHDILVTDFVPAITLANNGTQVGTANVAAGTTAQVLHKFSLAVATANAALTTVAFTTAGTYAMADIANLKLRYSTDAALDAGDATLATLTGPAAAGAKSFSSFSQTINSGSTGYFFITMDVEATPTGGNTISVNAIATGDLTIVGTKSGSTTAGGAQTLQAASTPTITVAAGTLTFGSVQQNGTSSEQTYTVSGANLTANIVITPPAGFEISTTSGSGFVATPSALTLTPSGGTVPSTTIYARFKPTAITAYSANIAHTSTGATTQNKAVTGTGIASSASDIVRDTGFTEPANVAYASYPETDLTASSLQVGSFTIRDGGGSADLDSAGTTLSEITFNVANSATLRRLALYDGSTELGEVAGGATAVFTGLSAATVDGGAKTLILRASFNAAVTDNQQVSFTVASATASAAGSVFTAANAGGAATDTTGDRNRIEVTATKLAFSSIPGAPVDVGAAFSATVQAQDVNNNLDLDSTASVTVSRATGTGMIGGGGALALAAGARAFSALTYDVAESFTLQATATGLATGTSGSLSAKVDAPTALAATPAGVAQNDLTWTRNALANHVLVVRHTAAISGTPAGSYVAGNAFPGGGTVVYVGNGTSASDTGLAACTLYYYKAWSLAGSGPFYSAAGTTATATTAIPAAPTGLYSNPTNTTGFTANWLPSAGASGYRIDVSTNVDFQAGGGSVTITNEGFADGTTPPSGWTFTAIGGTYATAGNYGSAAPALQMDATGDRVQTIALSSPTNVNFWIKGQGTDASSALWVEGASDGSWSTVSNVVPLPTSGMTISCVLGTSVTNLRFTYTKSVGNLSFDDVTVTGNGATPSYIAGYLNLAVGVTSQMVTSLQPGQTYYYRVRAEGATCTSGNSATGNVTTLSAAAPEIAVLGTNGVAIADGATAPLQAAGTWFDSIDAGTGLATRVFTITNSGVVALTISGVTASGANAGDFTVTAAPAGTVPAAGSTTFTVQFDPSDYGARTATLVVSNDDADEGTYDFAVGGTGTMALATALDTSGLAWVTDGSNSAAWFGQATTTHDGVDAAQSGTITDNGATWMYADVVGPGTVTFWWKASSEATYDTLDFFVGTNALASISGETGWLQYTAAVPAGVTDLYWQYSKDGRGTAGSDAGWVDGVVFTPTSTTPFSSFGINGPGNTSLTDAQLAQAITVTVAFADADGVNWNGASVAVPNASPFLSIADPAGTQVLAPTAFNSAGQVDGAFSCAMTAAVAFSATSAGVYRASISGFDQAGNGTNVEFTFTVADDDAGDPDILALTVDGVGGDGSTNLFAGGIAVVGVNGVTNTASIDRFSFVVLAPFPAGTTLWFTDCGWDSSSNSPAGGWRGLGELTTTGHTNNWTAQAGDGDVGKVIELSLDGAINSGGDQVVIFQYTGTQNPSNDPSHCKFLFAINMDKELDGWDTAPFTQDNEHSSLYPGLTNTVNAVSVPLKGGVANVMYTGTVTGTASYLLSEICKSNNWQVLPKGDYNLANFAFNVTGAGSFDWQRPDISDQQMRWGGYTITNIARDLQSGLLASNTSYGFAPYYVLFNTNDEVAVSNVFPTAYSNGIMAALVTNVAVASAGSYDKITLGTVGFVVGVSDADNDRANDSRSTTKAVDVFVYDDDLDVPTLNTNDLKGLGAQSFYSASGEVAFYDFGATTSESNLLPTRTLAAVAIADLTVHDAQETPSMASGNPSGGASASANGWNTADSFWEFTVTVQAGFTLDLQKLHFASQRSASGPTAWALRTSANGYGSDLASGTLSGSGSWETNSVSSLVSSESGGTVNYRLYGSGASSGSGTWRIDDVNFTGKVASASGAFIATDADLHTNGVSFSWSVRDTNSGISGLASPFKPTWSLVSPSNVAATNLTFGVGPTNGGARTAATNLIATNGFAYADIVLGVYTAWVTATDYDDDRVNDTLTATLTNALTVVDDDATAPKFSTLYRSFDGVNGSSAEVTDGSLTNGLSISNRVYDEKSGVLGASLQFRIQDPAGWNSGMQNFTIKPTDGGAKTSSYLAANSVAINDYDVQLNAGGGRALGTWTATFYAVDFDGDRPNDATAITQNFPLVVIDDDKVGPRMANLQASGAAGVLIATGFETNEGWSARAGGNWTTAAADGAWISTGAYVISTDGRGSDVATVGYNVGLSNVNVALQLPAVDRPGWLVVWAKLSAAGESKWVLERYDGGAWNSMGERSVTTTDYAEHSWLVDSTGTGVQLRLRLTERTAGNRSIYFDDLVVTPYRPWTNIPVSLTWGLASDEPTGNSGIGEYRWMSPRTSAPIYGTNGVSLGSAQTTALAPAKDVQGMVTGYVFAVDADEDRGARDRAMGLALPTVARLDITPPTAVPMQPNGASTENVDDPTSQFDLSWNPANVGPDKTDHANYPSWTNGNRHLLSPWRSYKIYYGPSDPVQVPAGDPGYGNGNSYVYTNFIATGAFSNDPAWKCVLSTNAIADPSGSGTNYLGLANVGRNTIRLYDLEFDRDYAVVIVGVDEAGNEGEATPASWATNNTIRFTLTRGLTMSKSQAQAAFPSNSSLTNANAETAAALYWSAAGSTNQQGGYTLVTKDYDLIYWDSTRFQERTNNDWQLAGTVRTNWFVDDGGQFRGRGQIRFYRASYKDRWKRTNTLGQTQRPLASEEVYALHNVVLSGGENYVALHGVPYTNTFAGVFGGLETFPGGSSALTLGGATVVEFFQPGATSASAEQYYLNFSGRWSRVGGGDITEVVQSNGFFTRGFSITLPNPLPSNYVTTAAYDNSQLGPDGKPVQIPAMVWSPIAQVPTNGFSQVISTGSRSGRVAQLVYNLAALRLPVSVHPGEMRLLESGFVNGPAGQSDEIYTINTATKGVQGGSTIYCDPNGVWRFTSGAGLVPAGYFKPNDVIMIVSRNGGMGNTWTWNYHPSQFYSPPTRWMEPAQ
jgi:hypothetical protein